MYMFNDGDMVEDTDFYKLADELVECDASTYISVVDLLLRNRVNHTEELAKLLWYNLPNERIELHSGRYTTIVAYYPILGDVVTIYDSSSQEGVLEVSLSDYQVISDGAYSVQNIIKLLNEDTDHSLSWGILIASLFGAIIWKADSLGDVIGFNHPYPICQLEAVRVKLFV